MIVSSSVPPNFKDRPIIEYLSFRFTYFSKDDWIRRFDEGRIFLNNQILLSPDRLLRPKDIVGYDTPPFEEPPADLNFRVMYEDQWLLAVDKPGNLLVHKSGRSFTSNLVYQLRFCHKPAAYPGIDAINRLDRETSGIVLFAKDKNSLRTMNEALSRQAVHKEYLAIVQGLPPKQSWTIDLPIGKTQSSIRYKSGIDPVMGKESRTSCELVRRLGDRHALLRVKPITGRTHQIRVHLAAEGLPIVGDLLYGGTEEEFLAWRRDSITVNSLRIFKRHALHCNLVSFQHPVTKIPLTLEAALPKDMLEFIASLNA